MLKEDRKLCVLIPLYSYVLMRVSAPYLPVVMLLSVSVTSVLLPQEGFREIGRRRIRLEVDLRQVLVDLALVERQ